MGRGEAERASDRSLVADGDGLGHLWQSGRARTAARQARIPDRADAGLRLVRAGREVPAASSGADGHARYKVATAAIVPPNIVEQQ